MSPEATERSFDELTRGLASGSISRGRALRLMGAALVGGTLTSLGMGGIAAADDLCKPLTKKCRKNAQCCSGKCQGGTCACQANGGSCTTNVECCSGFCFTQYGSGSGVCISPSGTTPIHCECVGAERNFDVCTSAACGSDDARQVCDAMCAQYGGVLALQCIEDTTLCVS
jgi:hypothetical protein